MDQYIPNPPDNANPGSEEPEPRLRCHFCGKTSTWDEAVDGGWTPDFYFPDGTCSADPACQDCAMKHLRRGADGEYEVR